MMARRDLTTRLPRRHTALPAGARLIVDRGFTGFAPWAALSARGITWLRRANTNLKDEVERLFVHTDSVRDPLIWVGREATRQPGRLIEIQAQGTISRYLTNALDLQDWPRASIAALYAQRGRVEEAIAKRLLGLAYFYGGAQNAVQRPLWATWSLCAVLVDLTDALAEALGRPFADLAMEMLSRRVYFVVGALARDPTTDPVRSLAEEVRDLGIIKRPRQSAPHRSPSP